MRLEERDCDLPFDVSNKARTVSAPWKLNGTGEPTQLPIPPGAKAYYDLKAQIMHIRDAERGRAATATPGVWLTLDFSQDFHELEFSDLEDPSERLGGVFINEGRLEFEDQGKTSFTNSVMYDCFIRLLRSPVFNPWTRLPEIDNENGLFICDLAAGTIEIAPWMEGATSVDQNRCEIVTFRFRSEVPIQGWNKDTRDTDLLPPGLYDARVLKAHWVTGEPEEIRVEGYDPDKNVFHDFLIEFEEMFRAQEREELVSGEFTRRTAFDPRGHTDMALRAAEAPPPRKGLLSKLMGR